MIVPAAHVAVRPIVARAETRTTVRVGDVVIFPLYDSQRNAMYYGTGLRRLGIRHIARHDLWHDLHLNGRGGIDDAASDRGEAFAAIARGSGSVNVLLLLPRMKQRCASCRTIHYFFTVR